MDVTEVTSEPLAQVQNDPLAELSRIGTPAAAYGCVAMHWRLLE